jgi:hypothetical protein
MERPQGDWSYCIEIADGKTVYHFSGDTDANGMHALSVLAHALKIDALKCGALSVSMKVGVEL